MNPARFWLPASSTMAEAASVGARAEHQEVLRVNTGCRLTSTWDHSKQSMRRPGTRWAKKETAVSARQQRDFTRLSVRRQVTRQLIGRGLAASRRGISAQHSTKPCTFSQNREKRRNEITVPASKVTDRTVCRDGTCFFRPWTWFWP